MEKGLNIITRITHNLHCGFNELWRFLCPRLFSSFSETAFNTYSSLRHHQSACNVPTVSDVPGTRHHVRDTEMRNSSSWAQGAHSWPPAWNHPTEPLTGVSVKRCQCPEKKVGWRKGVEKTWQEGRGERGAEGTRWPCKAGRMCRHTLPWLGDRPRGGQPPGPGASEDGVDQSAGLLWRAGPAEKGRVYR